MRIDKDEIADFEFRGNQDLTYIRIGEDVRKIGEKAFANSPNLTGVVIEESDCPIRICVDAFSNCKHLVDITIKRQAIFYKKIKYGRKL